jgi:hypothetical protein
MDCLRRVDTNLTLPQVEDGRCVFGGDLDPHCVGQAWSSALWTIRGTLGEPAADKLIIQAQYSLTPNATFQDASLALLAADQALNGGANQTFLKNLLSSRGLVDLEHIDDTIATAQPLAVPGQVSGNIDAFSDPHDVYKLQLTVGHRIVVRSTSAADVDLRLYAPSSTSLSTGTIVAGATTAGTGNETFSYVAAATGTYFLDVNAASGSGGYTLETQSDADADGVLDGSDNCPTVPNPSQADWNHNGKGDACDPAAQVTVKSVTVRKHTVTFVAQVQPASVQPNAWQVLVQRRVCGGACRYASPARVSGKRKLAAGRIQLTFALARPGLYRLQAVLTDPRYAKAKSRFAAVRIAGKARKAAKSTRRPR